MVRRFWKCLAGGIWRGLEKQSGEAPQCWKRDLNDSIRAQKSRKELIRKQTGKARRLRKAQKISVWNKDSPGRWTAGHERYTLTAVWFSAQVLRLQEIEVKGGKLTVLAGEIPKQHGTQAVAYVLLPFLARFVVRIWGERQSRKI